MSDAEIKATASLDDKLTPALNRVEANVKKSSDSMEGHLKKFAFNADDFTSKLARSFSAVDIAAGVAAGAIVAMGAKTEQVYNKALKAFVESNDAARESLKRFEDAIHKNDENVGRAAFKLEMLRKEIELFASEKTAKGVAVINAVASAAMALGKYGLGGNDQRGKGGTGSGGASGAGVGPPFDPNPDPSAINRRTEAAYQAMIDARRPAGGGTARTFYDPGAFPDTGLGDKRWFASYNRYRGSVPDMNIQEPGGLGMNLGKGGDAADRQLAANERLADSMMKAQKYTDTLAQGLSATFSGMLFDGMKLSDGLKNIFRGLVDDILGELSAKAASSIVKAALTLLDTGPTDPRVQVAPAWANSEMQRLDYQRARGR